MDKSKIVLNTLDYVFDGPIDSFQIDYLKGRMGYVKTDGASEDSLLYYIEDERYVYQIGFTLMDRCVTIYKRTIGKVLTRSYQYGELTLESQWKKAKTWSMTMQR